MPFRAMKTTVAVRKESESLLATFSLCLAARVNCIPFSNFILMDCYPKISWESAVLVSNWFFVKKPLVEDGSFASLNTNDWRGNMPAFFDFLQVSRKSCRMVKKAE